MSRVTVGLRETRRPVSGETIGERLVAVVPNRAQFNQRNGTYQTSYAARFRVHESGDRTVGTTDQTDMDLFERELRSSFFGFTSVDWEI